MADNVTITYKGNSTPPAGTVIASDDYDGVHYQKLLVADGAVPDTRTLQLSLDGNMLVAEQVRLVGTFFEGTTLDPNFWTETTAANGSVTVAGEAALKTGAVANGTASLVSVRVGRFLVGVPNVFKTTCEWLSAGDTDNVRRIGAYNANNGFFFELDGTTFSVGIRYGGTTVLTNSGSFNGDDADYTPGTGRHTCKIIYSAKKVEYFIDGVHIHTTPITHSNHPEQWSLPVTIENINDNGNTTDNEFHIVGATIFRQGKLQTNCTYSQISGASTGQLKYGPGILHSVVNTNNAGTITVYDNTVSTGTQIAVIDASKALGALLFDAPFNNGLRVVTAGAVFCTVIYE